MNFGTIVFVLSLIILSLSSCRPLERPFLYRPTNSALEPQDWGLPARALHLSTPDGETLEGWWIPNPGPDSKAMLIFPGRRGFRARHMPNALAFWSAGYSIMVFQYRGYGSSSGSPTEEGLITDGLTAFDWLRRNAGHRPIVLFGRSLGGAVAAQVALRRNVDALVLESTFTSMPAIIREILNLPGLENLVRTKFNTLEAVARMDTPLIVVHGTDDTLVPIEMGYALFKASRASVKRFYEVRGGTHWNTFRLAGTAYTAWIQNIVEAVCAAGSCNGSGQPRAVDSEPLQPATSSGLESPAVPPSRES